MVLSISTDCVLELTSSSIQNVPVMMYVCKAEGQNSGLSFSGGSVMLIMLVVYKPPRDTCMAVN